MTTKDGYEVSLMPTESSAEFAASLEIFAGLLVKYIPYDAMPPEDKVQFDKAMDLFKSATERFEANLFIATHNPISE